MGTDLLNTFFFQLSQAIARMMMNLNPRNLLEKIVTRSLEGGGGVLLSTQFI